MPEESVGKILGGPVSDAIDEFVQGESLKLWTRAMAAGGVERCVALVDIVPLSEGDFALAFDTALIRRDALPADVASAVGVDREELGPPGKLLIIFVFGILRIAIYVIPPRNMNSPRSGGEA